MYLDGLCIDVNPTQHAQQHLDPAGSHDIYHGGHDQLEPGPGLEPRHDDRPGRPRHQRRDLQLLPPGGAQQRAAGVERQRADRRRPGRQRGQAGPERDRLRRPRLAGQGRQVAEGQRRPLHAEQDQERSSTRCRGTSCSSSRPTSPNPQVQKFVDWARTQPDGRRRSSPRPAACPRSTRSPRRSSTASGDEVPPRPRRLPRPRTRPRGGPTGAPSSCSARWSAPSSACCWR